MTLYEQSFVPQTHDGYGERVFATMLVELSRCPCCKKPMISAPPKEWARRWTFYDFDGQVKRAGWVWTSQTERGDGYGRRAICRDCETAGKGTFTCVLCKEERQTSAIHERYGDPPEFLCVSCYETVPAKAWDEKTNELEEAHRWDHE